MVKKAGKVDQGARNKIKPKFKLKDFPLNERPRERLLKFGPEALSEAELLALILRTGTKDQSILELCRELLKRYDLKKLSRLCLNELSQIEGIKIAKAAQLVACFELGRRVAGYCETPKIVIASADDVANLLNPQMLSLKVEHLKILLLNSKNVLMGIRTISIGSLNSSLIHPREIFKTALAESAAAIILVHNHPSGDPLPSKADIRITERIVKAGKILGIAVLDHIIIGENAFVSLKEEGVF